jgi:hypothetical protein
MAQDIFKVSDTKFLEWLRFLLPYIIAHAERFRILPPDDAFAALVANFELCVQKCLNPNRGKLDISEKNEVRKELEKRSRELVQGFLAKNPYVTKVDRDAMGITVYDTIPTSVPEPRGQAFAEVTYLGKTQHLLTLQHVSSTPSDPKSEHGFRIFCKVCAHGEPIPQSGMDLTESRFSRQKKVQFSFTPEDSGKTAYYAVRYENSKGQSGPWGPLFSAIIP